MLSLSVVQRVHFRKPGSFTVGKNEVRRERSFLFFAIVTFCLTNLSWAMGPNEVERAMAALITSHPGQGRGVMMHDPVLHMVARAKAMDLGKRDFAAHVDPDGYGPNAAVIAAGYGLPDWWAAQTTIDSNLIESLGFGFGGDAKSVFNQWMDSPLHRAHVLAENEFFKEQTQFAVGYAEVPGSTFTHYFVFLSAPPNEAPNKDVEPYAEWLFDHYTVKEILTADDTTDADGDGLSRLMEFALLGDPNRKDVLPSPMKSRNRKQLEWFVPVNRRLGGLEVRGEYSTDLNTWIGEGIVREGDRFVIDLKGQSGFLRLTAHR